MADKKEIVDYLRNLQKASEIESKVNGINIWVLFGAIAFISWSILNLGDKSALENKKIVAAILVLSVLIFMGSILANDNISGKLATRHSIGVNLYEYPVLIIIYELLIFFPAIFSIYFGHFDLVVFLVFMVGLASLMATAKVILFHQYPGLKKKFNSVNKINPSHNKILFLNLIAMILLGLGIYQEVSFIYQSKADFGKNDFISLVLLTTLVVLVFNVVHRQIKRKDLDWVYAIETNLLLGTMDEDEALRIIERKKLGLSFEKEFKNILVDLDSIKKTLFDKFIVLSEKIDQDIDDINNEVDSVLAVINSFNEKYHKSRRYLEMLRIDASRAVQSIIVDNIRLLETKNSDFNTKVINYFNNTNERCQREVLSLKRIKK